MQVKARSKKLEDLKEYLLTERDRLRQEIALQTVHGHESAGYGNHIADDATATFEQAKSVALRRSSERRLADVEAALSRMDHGTYGICQRCEGRIDPARLKAMPSAGLCFKCQSRADEGA